MNELGGLEFKAEDFSGGFELFWFEVRAKNGQPLILAEQAAYRANQLLRERLEKAPIVHGGRMETGGNESWRFQEDKGDYPWDITHTARLVCIKEIGK